MSLSTERHRVVGEHEYDGVVYPGIIPKENLDRIKYNFQLRDDDVIISTYPKSGTTWFQEIVWLVMNNADVSGAKEVLLEDRVPFLEIDTQRIPGIIDILEKAESPRIFKTHLSYGFFKEQLKTNKTKLVFGVRNIKDTLVSFYHFYRMNSTLGSMTGSFEDFFELFREKRLVYGDWFDNNLEYWENRHSANFFKLMYEDLHRDFHGTVQKLASFLGKDISDDQLHLIAKHVAFDEMKGNDMVNKTVYPFLHHDISPFMRKGKVGDWKNHLSAEQNEYIDKLYKEKIEGSGLEFDFKS